MLKVGRKYLKFWKTKFTTKFFNSIVLQAPETDNAGDLIGGTEDVGGPETNGYEDVW